MLHRVQLFVLFALICACQSSLLDIPVSTWSTKVKGEYTRAVTDHIIPWPVQSGNSLSDLRYLEAQLTSASDTFVFREYFRGVATSNLRIVRYLTNGNAEVLDSMIRVPNTTSITAAKSSTQAVTDCINALGTGAGATTTANLTVVNYRSKFYLVYVVKAFYNARKCYTCYVDANTASLVIQSWTDTKGTTASSLYDGTVTIHTSLYSSVYYLEYATSKHAVFDCQGTDCTTTAIRQTSSTDTWSNNKAVSVAWAAEETYQYFLGAFARDGIDGAGGPGVVVSGSGTGNVFPHYINYNTNYNGALFTTSGIYYGSGDGVIASPLVSLDLVAHEWAHGVLHYSVPGGNGMYNFDESGALEESFCDVIGALVDNFVYGETANTWKFGENWYSPGNGKALRYLNDPPLADNKGLTANDDPDYYANRYTGTTDNGGIHTNNGIANKAFYLLAKGGHHPNGGPNMTGVGIPIASQIWYKAFTTYMTYSASFLDARDATVSACNSLYGAANSACFQVQVAWGLCGVGTVPTPTPTQLFANPSAERTQSPWVLSGSGASWYSDGLNSFAGSGYLAMGNGDSVSGSWSSATIIMANNTQNATLVFQLKITTSETTTTLMKDTLSISLRSATTNALLATLGSYSNLDATGAYVSRLLIVGTTYKNTPVKVVFQEDSDSANPTQFYLDVLNFNTYLY